MKIITDTEEVRKTFHWLKQAAKVARSSECKKSQRGVVIVRDDKIIGSGYNKPTISDLCCLRDTIRDNSKLELCTAIHAEQMAVINSLKRGNFLENARMYHIKIKDGQTVQSSYPSCTACSKINLEVDLEFVLWQKEGYVLYSAEEFNQASFDYFLK